MIYFMLGLYYRRRYLDDSTVMFVNTCSCFFISIVLTFFNEIIIFIFIVQPPNENVCLISRASAHLLLHSRNNSCRKEDACAKGSTLENNQNS